MNRIYLISLSLSCFVLLTSNRVNAQDTLKPSLKGWSTELNINPFNGSLTLNNANSQIKIRKFLPNGNALRLAFTLGYKNDEDKTDNPYGLSPFNSKDKKQSFEAGINFGTEKHFQNNRRISPYIGWEAGFGYKSAKEVITNDENTLTVQGAWQSYDVIYNGQNPYYSINYIERGFLSVGANVLTGFDFYMAQDFYFGYELGFGIEYTKYSKIETTQSPMVPDNRIYPEQEGSSWKVGPRLLNGIRIGYSF